MRYLLIIFYLFFGLMCFAQKQTAYDSSVVAVRSFSSQSIDVYKKDKHFMYKPEAVEQPSLWDRFWGWVWQKYFQMMSTQKGQNTFYTVLIILGVIAIIFLILKINKMSKTNLFRKGANDNLKYAVEDENINTINFEEEISKALNNSNYRLAIRLVYLQSLKLLSDKEIIVWQLNKTNSNYANEINSSSLKILFTGITNIFEYSWYGDAAVENDNYEIMQEKFTEIKNTLS